MPCCQPPEAQYSGPEHAGTVDVLGVVYDFIAECVAPAVDPANIYRGYENRAALPAGTNDFCIISIVQTVRRGTVDSKWHFDRQTGEGTETIHSTQNVDVQIDFFGDDDKPRLRAMAVDALAGSARGARFFRDRNISCLYADTARDVTAVGDSDEFLRRYMVTLHLCVAVDLVSAIDGFNVVRVDRIYDVDTLLRTSTGEIIK